jgi:hypothetical protein
MHNNNTHVVVSNNVLQDAQHVRAYPTIRRSGGQRGEALKGSLQVLLHGRSLFTCEYIYASALGIGTTATSTIVTHTQYGNTQG